MYRSSYKFNIELAELIFRWFLERGDIVEWLDVSLMEHGPGLFAQLDCLTSFEVGRVMLGMAQWVNTQHRTLGGAGNDVDTFLVKKVNHEARSDPFLASVIGFSHGVPVSKECLSMVGEAVKRSKYYTENATELRRGVRRTKAVRNVLVT